MSRLAEKLFHIVLWILFIVVSFMGVISSKSLDLIPYAWRNLLALLYTVPLFYLYYSYYIPQFLAKRKIWQFLLIAAVTIIFFGTIIWLVDSPFRRLAGLDTWTNIWWKGYTRGILGAFYVTIISIVFRFVIDWFRNQQVRLELINKNQASELALMKSQINPHFLFNTLNNIYSLANRHDDKALDAMVKLSGIMRYLIYDTQADRVLLQREVEYLENYLELQRLRLRDPGSVQYSVDGEMGELKIAPMLLIPFVENAFKHGDKKAKAPTINIELTVNSNVLVFRVKNSIPERVIEKDRTEGIGLVNLRKRLEILYQNRHKLKITDQNGIYQAYLEIKLDK